MSGVVLYTHRLSRKLFKVNAQPGASDMAEHLPKACCCVCIHSNTHRNRQVFIHALQFELFLDAKCHMGGIYVNSQLKAGVGGVTVSIKSVYAHVLNECSKVLQNINRSSSLYRD